MTLMIGKSRSAYKNLKGSKDMYEIFLARAKIKKAINWIDTTLIIIIAK